MVRVFLGAMEREALFCRSTCTFGDSSGGLVVKNPPSNAEDVGSIFGQETKILHALGQLTPHSSTTEPVYSRAPALQQEKPKGHNWREAPHYNQRKPTHHSKGPTQPNILQKKKVPGLCPREHGKEPPHSLAQESEAERRGPERFPWSEPGEGPWDGGESGDVEKETVLA